MGRVLTAMLACVSGVHFYSIAVAQPRCAVRLCAAATASPSRDLAPVEVTTAQLEALQQGDVEQCYLFASPANRRNIGSADDLEVVVKSPSYQALVGCSSFKILSALSMGDRWAARVRVLPSEASLACRGRTATFEVGDRVTITADRSHLKLALAAVEYSWADAMEAMAGKTWAVLELRPPSRGTNIVGLPSPDGSQKGIWYFPVTALEAGGVAEDPEAAAEVYEYRWELSRQPEAEQLYEARRPEAHTPGLTKSSAAQPPPGDKPLLLTRGRAPHRDS